MVNFRYASGEAVKVADRVRTGNGKDGVIVEVIHPDTIAASHFSCPGGGVLIEEFWGDESNLILETPPDAESWEDLEFIARAGVD